MSLLKSSDLEYYCCIYVVLFEEKLNETGSIINIQEQHNAHLFFLQVILFCLVVKRTVANLNRPMQRYIGRSGPPTFRHTVHVEKTFIHRMNPFKVSHSRRCYHVLRPPQVPQTRPLHVEDKVSTFSPINVTRSSICIIIIRIITIIITIIIIHYHLLYK